MDNTQIPEQLHKALVDQYNFERESAYIYESMSAAFEDVNWAGFAHWFKKQVEEELSHANKFFKYLADRQVAIIVAALPQPPEYNGEDIVGNFQAALAHEVVVTQRLTNLAQLAFQEGDLLTFELMQWFLHEQVEEEMQIVQILSDLGHGEGCDAAILMIDRELSKR